MSKYIIDIPDDIPLNPQFLHVYGTEPIGNKIRTYTIEMDETEELNSDYINEHYGQLQDEAYDKGYAQCQNDYGDALKHAKDTAYQRGFEKGKDVRIKGCEGCMYQDATIEHNPCNLCCNAFLNRWTAKDDKFEFSDEVIDSNGVKGCVVSKDNEGYDTMYALFDGYRTPQYVTQSKYHKTGKRYHIEKILEEMKGDNDK